MGIASFVVGLSCLILSPFLSVFLILPSILGLILGIIDTVLKCKKNESKGLSVAGIVLSTISLAICILITIGIYIYASNNISSDLSIDNIFSNTTGEILSSDVICNIGDSATLDNIKVTFKDADLNFKNYEDYAYLPDGYSVLKADFEFENTGNSYEYITYYDFECFADKFSCDTFYYVDDYYFSESLEPGEKLTASVYFEIPQNADSIELEYDSNSYDEGKIIFNLEDENK